MARPPAPLDTLGSRLPEAGRIRLGEKYTTKNGKTAMRGIDKLRFTSPERDLIEQIAAQYGGECVPWNDTSANPPRQWQVYTEVSEIAVVLPMGGLSTWYEKWGSGAGKERQCDGRLTSIPVPTPGGYEMEICPCICVANDDMQCTPVSRLNVALPDVRFAGLWRCESKGWNALHELRGMVDIIDQLNARGQPVRCILSIDHRVQRTKGGKRDFVLPKLALASSMMDLVSGQSAVAALDGPRVPAPVAGELGTGAPSLAPVPEPLHSDGAGDIEGIGEIVDAEIVSEEEQRIYEIAQLQHLDATRLWNGLLIATKDDDEATRTERIRRAIGILDSGKSKIIGFNTDGSIIWKNQ